MSLDKQKILNELGSVVNQLQSADCGCMSRLFNDGTNPGHYGDGHACHGGHCGWGCNPCAGEPHMASCVARCNPPKLIADTYNYYDQHVVKPAMEEVYNELKTINPENTIGNHPLASQMGAASAKSMANFKDSTYQGGAIPNQGQQMINSMQGRQFMGVIDQHAHVKGVMQGQVMNGLQAQPLNGLGEQATGSIQQHPAALEQYHGHTTGSMISGQGQFMGGLPAHNQGQLVNGMAALGGMSAQNLGQGMSQMVAGHGQHTGGITGSPGQTMGGQFGGKVGRNSQQLSQMNSQPMAHLRGNQQSVGEHAAALQKFNEVFPGVMSGDLPFNPMEMAIKMNPDNGKPQNIQPVHQPPVVNQQPMNQHQISSNMNQQQMQPLVPQQPMVSQHQMQPMVPQQQLQPMMPQQQLQPMMPQQQLQPMMPQQQLQPMMPQQQQQPMMPQQQLQPIMPQQQLQPMMPQQQLQSMMPQQQLQPMVPQQQMQPMITPQQIQPVTGQQQINPQVVQQQMPPAMNHQQLIQHQLNHQLINQNQINPQQENQQLNQPQLLAAMNQQQMAQQQSPVNFEIPSTTGATYATSKPFEKTDPQNMQQPPILEPIMPVEPETGFNTLGQPVEMVPGNMYHRIDTGETQPIIGGGYGYSNVKNTISKTSIMGQNLKGSYKTPSRSQLQHLYHQYKGSQSYTQQNIQDPKYSGTASDGKLDVMRGNPTRQHIPLERTGGDTSMNNKINQPVKDDGQVNVQPIKVEQIAEEPIKLLRQENSDSKKAEIKEASPALSKKCRNGLQDMVYTSYSLGASWTFHGSTPPRIYRPAALK